jgi:hypothetical protein
MACSINLCCPTYGCPAGLVFGVQAQDAKVKGMSSELSRLEDRVRSESAQQAELQVRNACDNSRCSLLLLPKPADMLEQVGAAATLSHGHEGLLLQLCMHCTLALAGMHNCLHLTRAAC